MSGFTRSPSCSPDFIGPQPAQDVSMMQTVTYIMSHHVWTNATFAKEFVKVKTYSDLLVLRQDAYSVIDRSNLGSVGSVSNLWEGILTTR
jgi:hypothetical protein